jgi:nucleoside-diphosphate-sugar epimerase
MPVNLPISPYAATKAANELLAHSYAACHKLNTTGLRFFTVYGPYGRPDMALWIFADAMLTGSPIPLFNNGDMVRDFTYVDDVVDAIIAAGGALPQGERGLYRILNVGGGSPVPVRRFVDALESALKVKATIKQLPMQVSWKSSSLFEWPSDNQDSSGGRRRMASVQPRGSHPHLPLASQTGDVLSTHCDASLLIRTLETVPKVAIERGVRLFADWFMAYRDNPERQTRQSEDVAVENMWQRSTKAREPRV